MVLLIAALFLLVLDPVGCQQISVVELALALYRELARTFISNDNRLAALMRFGDLVVSFHDSPGFCYAYAVAGA